MSDIINRLRCRYPQGPILENGEPEFGWREFGGPVPTGAKLPMPIMLEAADRIAELEREVQHWKANHDNMVAKNALLSQRPDLPADRIPAMRKLDELERQNAELQQMLASAYKTAATVQPVTIDGGEGWELLAMAICEDEGDDPHEMVYEGYPPEPWGETWQRYERDAKKMIEMVRKYAAPQLQAAQSEDSKRLDWLDEVNARTNEKHGTLYGWKFDINRNRAALMDHNWPAKSIRAAIDDARTAIAQAGKEQRNG